MSVTNKLLFFNKEGYPYNFTYENEIWTGKILFEPNGTDTFKNLSMYILEKVDPISLTENLHIVNSELYNINGMSVIPSTTSNFTIDKITPVNKSGEFYSKWVYGTEINKKFPVSTIISFSGNIDVSDIVSPNGEDDFVSTKLYTVISTKKNAIMIITDTPNDVFNLSYDNGTETIYADFSAIRVNSFDVISYPEFNEDLQSEYNPDIDMKISVIGTKCNDGVYELENKNKTDISIYDFTFSETTSYDEIELDVKLLTERPLLYNGGIDIYSENDILYAHFLNKKNVSIDVGTEFIVENDLGNHLYNSSVYTIESFLDSITLGEDIVYINKKSETDDDGNVNYFTELIYNPNIISLSEQDDVYLEYNSDYTDEYSSYYSSYENFSTYYNYSVESLNILENSSNDTLKFANKRTFTTDQIINIEQISGSTVMTGQYKIVSGGTKKIFSVTKISGDITKFNGRDLVTLVNTKKNDNIKFKVLSINNATVDINGTSTSVIINGVTYKKALININLVENGLFRYKFTKIFKEYEKNIAIVTSSISEDNTGTVTGRCLSTSNILKLTHEYINSVSETIETFITKYSGILNYNGIDLYRMGNSIILESLYYGQKYYFTANLMINSTVVNSYSTYGVDNISSVYNLILKDCDLTYEKSNMSDTTSNVFYADVELSLSDDVRDYGFTLNINDIDYYIEYNDLSGTTSYTATTISSFVDKWVNVFNNKGLLLYQGNEVDGTLNHIYVSGVEPNVTVNSFKVRVNKFSSYTINKDTFQYNSYMMCTSNYLFSDSTDFIANEFSTGMIISLYGSQYPSNNKEFNIIGILPTDSLYNKIELSFQGDMYTDYDSTITIISREYLRRPRETNIKDIYYKFRWEDDTKSEMFMYDLSGENLIPWKNHIDYKYTGPKPLPLNGDYIFLNTLPNDNLLYVDIPYRQQTVFDELKFILERYDDDNATILPKPINVSFAYKSLIEGVHYRKLIMERVDYVVLDGHADGETLYFTISGNKVSVVDTQNNINLLDLGFEIDRSIRFKLVDNNEYTTNIFEDWQDFIITDVTTKTITLDSTLTDFSTKGFEFNYSFEQLPKTMGEFTFYGETEGEDERLKSHMKLFGINLSESDEYIFSESNIKEQGVDYQLLNRKRKEMMTVYPKIYNYIGSYTALFNAITFFGYNDLELYEYYRNVDPNSPLFNSLKRIIVQDLFDRDIEGWSYSEEVSKLIGYSKTNLLNLTYKITDEEGNNTNLYSLSDVQIKLNGLKEWLRKWIIPINHNIRDITGVSENTNTIWRQFDSANDIIKHRTEASTETVNFNYITSKNFNDSWLVSVRFYNVNGFIPEYFDLKVVTYIKDSNNLLIPQSYYNIYKTDMLPFNFYMNWNDGISDKYLFVETTYYSNEGVGKKINKMYGLEDGVTYVYDEYKNYILINNNFEYKYQSYVQDKNYVYINDDEGNIYVITK